MVNFSIPMSNETTYTDYEQERRVVLLRTSMLSDCRVSVTIRELDVDDTTPFHSMGRTCSLGPVFSLHKTFLVARSQYFMTLFAPSHNIFKLLGSPMTNAMGEIETPLYTIELPHALTATDGSWHVRDVERFWWHLYATETQWTKDWRAAAMDVEKQSKGLDPNEFRAFLRLHRIADILQHEALVNQIEHFLLGPWGIGSWVRYSVDTNDNDFLTQRLQMFFEACDAVPNTRFALARGALCWLFTVGLTLYNHPEQTRQHWLEALEPYTWFSQSRFQHPVILHDEASTTVMCDHCMTAGTNVYNRVDLSSQWFILRARDVTVSQTLVNMAPTMQYPNTIVDYVHVNTKTGAHIHKLGLRPMSRTPSGLAVNYSLPDEEQQHKEKDTQVIPLLIPGHSARCARCQNISDTVHVFVLRERRENMSPLSNLMRMRVA